MVSTATGFRPPERFAHYHQLMTSQIQPVWHTRFWIWDVYLIAGTVVAIAIVLLFPNRLEPRPMIAAVLLAVLIVWLVGFGRSQSATQRGDRRVAVFLCGAMTLIVAAMALTPTAFGALPVAYPLLFMSLGTPAAVLATIAISVVPLLAQLGWYGLSGNDLAITVALTAMTLVISPMIGIWVRTAMTQGQRLETLTSELASSRAEAAQLAHEAGTTAERGRLAREIHDTLAQGFTSIVTLSQAADALWEQDPDAARAQLRLIEQTARENLVESRSIVADLSPTPIADASLADALRRLGERHRAETGVPVSVSAESAALPTATEVVLLRAAQEALTNVRRHADAVNVQVILRHRDGIARLTVRDNGIGFDTRAPGYGLTGMRQRVRQIGGTMRVDSAPGSGTRIEVEVPA